MSSILAGGAKNQLSLLRGLVFTLKRIEKGNCEAIKTVRWTVLVPGCVPQAIAQWAILAGGARLSTVIACELVSVGCKDGVTHIHTWAIVKWGSLPTAIPKENKAVSLFVRQPLIFV